MQRGEVYILLDQERDYQDSRWNGTLPDEKHSVADWILIMESYILQIVNK